MLKKLSEVLIRRSQEERSVGYKIVATIVGALLFLVVIPLVLYLFGFLFETYVLPSHIRSLERSFGIFCLVLGLLYLAWSVITLAMVGRGTPNPMAPTHRLVTTGPFKYSRNPIKLGALIYYLGVGTMLGSIWIGLVMLVIGFVIGCTYHKLVEEKELASRFGKEYEDYRDATPFLFPRLWK